MGGDKGIKGWELFDCLTFIKCYCDYRVRRLFVLVAWRGDDRAGADADKDLVGWSVGGFGDGSGLGRQEVRG